MPSLRHQSDLLFADVRIPSLKSPSGRQPVDFYACGEKLLQLSPLYPNRIVVDSQYYNAGYFHAMKECYARELVAHKLCEAAELLPEGWKIVIFDAWRPLTHIPHPQLAQSVFT